MCISRSRFWALYSNFSQRAQGGFQKFFLALRELRIIKKQKRKKAVRSTRSYLIGSVYGVVVERHASPVDFNLGLNCYDSAYPKAHVFGGNLRDEGVVWTETGLANPEHTTYGSLQAIKDALVAVEWRKTSTILLLPIWKDNLPVYEWQ